MERPVINYIYDPLCGWCYGFSQVIQDFYAEHKDEIDFRVLSGGMIIGGREGPLSDMANYLKEAYKEVENTTGVKFGEDFLKKLDRPGDEELSSLPGALATTTFRMYQPDNAIAFAARIQKAIYYEGLSPTTAKTYGYCAEDFGMNADDFMKLMVSKEKLELVKKEFEVVKNWGIRGFPTVVYQKQEKGQIIARGYTPLDKLNEHLALAKNELG
jgi:putative protein-disulfide isomerase